MIKAVTVGMNSCGIAAGAREVYSVLESGIVELVLPVQLKIVGCAGMCYREPLVDVVSDDGIIGYGEVTEEGAKKILEEHLRSGSPIEEWVIKKITPPEQGSEIWDIDGFFSQQKRIALENSGYIDPESIEDYRAAGGYAGLEKALTTHPEKIIEEITASGLRGRGGAGFPTGMKWKMTREAAGRTKYVICNADEGDPGAFMDRNILEGDPHRVLEGMAIGSYAMGVSEAIIYVRAEYPLAIRRLQIALEQARDRNFLGERIFGSDFSLEIHIKEGAGAFVCGEETALIHSIEGQRGMPRPRPPYPAERGLHGCPTNINNVETWANISWILRRGAESYAAYGRGNSKGTKVFALAGKVKRGGNVEIPMGMSINEVLHTIAGETKTGKNIKAVQMGGPSGGCIPYRLFNTSITYEDITLTGAIMGSGGMIVVDEDTCMVDIAKFFLDFTVKESCGKCTFCRLGTKRMWEILDKITSGRGTEEDLARLEELAAQVKAGSLCGLGQTAPNPVLTTLRYFRNEYMAHVVEKRCPSHVCKSLLKYIITTSCEGCHACFHICPVSAIEGEKKGNHTIIQEKCIKCGSCLDTCKFGAIEIRGIEDSD